MKIKQKQQICEGLKNAKSLIGYIDSKNNVFSPDNDFLGVVYPDEVNGGFKLNREIKEPIK